MIAAAAGAGLGVQGAVERLDGRTVAATKKHASELGIRFGQRKPKRKTAAPAGKSAVAGTQGPVTPAVAAGPEPPTIDFSAIEKMGLEEQLKLVAHLARSAEKESDRMTAHKILADLRRKEAPPERDEGAVPPELVALWNRPSVRTLLERLVAAERGAA